ncbi:hypothetical protein THASP1DRAFT_32375 [Thamnocephalis sphaerospora]|uniref:Uncharacterized protein n=1 Tax=Thamnocephalis sphaerospora TaxID=78915 RepID=A0A4P9XJ73_9FUNG|nr:hypothetical protein THASP1DRAFT_32375 [Thamnocephalis sphaerospora]|eukprot:RKP05794.1 hypothetical protein THASP1DRAFT_32375 [Thamnocephalis sphaerospora]
MRIVSLLNIAAAATLAVFIFLGSSASATGAVSLNPAREAFRGRSRPIPPIKDQLVAFREYSRLFTIYPHFGLLQPEETQVVYKSDTLGRVKSVDFVNADGVTVLKALLEYRPVLDPLNPSMSSSYSSEIPQYKQIQHVFLKAYPEAGGPMIDYAFIRFIYKDTAYNRYRNYNYDSGSGPSSDSDSDSSSDFDSDIGDDDDDDTYGPFFAEIEIHTPRGVARVERPVDLYGDYDYIVSSEEESFARSIAFPEEERLAQKDELRLHLPNQPLCRVWLIDGWKSDKISIMPASTIDNLWHLTSAGHR